MGDTAFLMAKSYSMLVQHEAVRLRILAVEAAHHIREQVQTHRETFLHLSREAFDTIPEANLAQASKDLRHVADVIDALNAQIASARSPAKLMEAAE